MAHNKRKREARINDERCAHLLELVEGLAVDNVKRRPADGVSIGATRPLRRQVFVRFIQLAECTTAHR